MGRVYIERFEESHPDFDSYMCKTCKTDIALGLADCGARIDVEEYLNYQDYYAVNSGLEGVHHFLEVRNVVIDEKVPWKAGPHTVADVHCVKCMDLIGFKLIEVSTDVERVIRVGDFQLIMDKLEYCDEADEGMEEQEEEPAEQEQAGEMGEQEQAAAVGEQEEEPAEQEQAAEMGEQEQAATVGEQEEEPAEAAEQEQDVDMGEQEQSAAVKEQLPEDP